MIDKWIYCDSNRKSPETGVPILLERKVYQEIGGALNAIRHIKHQRDEIPIKTFLTCSEEDLWVFVFERLASLNVQVEKLFEDNHGISEKSRYYLGEEPLFRHDRDFVEKITEESQSKIQEYLSKNFDTVGSVLVSDYQKGFVVDAFINGIATTCRKNEVPTVIDATHQSLGWVENFEVVKPNESAWGNFVKTLGNEKRAIDDLLSRGNRQILITMGGRGIRYVTRTIDKVESAVQVKVRDVTGAGDAIAAAISIILYENKNLSNFLEDLSRTGALAVSRKRTSLPDS
jgi:D-beta-D-heptose 7-phosphate kinase/D-beta-D-heptose 1-phosphate adenosyltransferase